MTYYDALLTEIPDDLTNVVIGLSSGVLKIDGMADTTLTNCILDEPVLTKEMEPAYGQIAQLDALKIWQAKYSVKPPLGSVLVHHGIYWTILSVLWKQQVATYEVRCRNLSIVPSTINTVAILEAKKHCKGKANEAVGCYKGYVSNEYPPTDADKVTCRLQPDSTDAKIQFDAEWSKETFRAYFQTQLPIHVAGSDWRLVDEEGNRYRILRYYDAERIDTLPVAICIAITEGVEFFQPPSGPPQPLPLPPLD